MSHNQIVPLFSLFRIRNSVCAFKHANNFRHKNCLMNNAPHYGLHYGLHSAATNLIDPDLWTP